MSLINRLLKANPSAQVSDMLTGYFVIPSAKQNFVGNARALWIGGNTSHTKQTTIDYININTLSNATDFGDLTTASNAAPSSAASSTRAVFARDTDNEFEYVTFDTLGNSTDFGDFSASQRRNATAGVSDSTRGIFAGGLHPTTEARFNTIDYLTIATTGNLTDFGDLTLARYGVIGAASTTRGLWAGGNFNATGAGVVNEIDYVTIASTGNATDFGDLTVARDGSGGGSNSTRAIFSGGNLASTAITNTIDYITIASTGNATDFGDFSSNRRYQSGVAGPTRLVLTGGLTTQGGTYTISVTMEYLTIATTGNSTTFGDLSQSRWALAGASSVHGGL
jgi:hypothetical protein